MTVDDATGLLLGICIVLGAVFTMRLALAVRAFRYRLRAKEREWQVEHVAQLIVRANERRRDDDARFH